MFWVYVQETDNNLLERAVCCATPASCTHSSNLKHTFHLLHTLFKRKTHLPPTLSHPPTHTSGEQRHHAEHGVAYRIAAHILPPHTSNPRTTSSAVSARCECGEQSFSGSPRCSYHHRCRGKSDRPTHTYAHICYTYLHMYIRAVAPLHRAVSSACPAAPTTTAAEERVMAPHIFAIHMYIFAIHIYIFAVHIYIFAIHM